MPESKTKKLAWLSDMFYSGLCVCVGGVQQQQTEWGGVGGGRPDFASVHTGVGMQFQCFAPLAFHAVLESPLLSTVTFRGNLGVAAVGG